MYKITPNSDQVKAVVHSRAGKVGGKFGACFNVINKKDEMPWLDFNRCVSNWQPITQNELTEFVLFINDEMSETEKDAIDNAKVKELENWKNNQVYAKAEDKNQTKISTRWLITTKVIGEDKINKAKLVARDFEDEEIMRLTTDSPTFFKESLHLVLTIMSINSWNLSLIRCENGVLARKSN